VIFWDSSALARGYFESEPGHPRAKNLLLASESHFGSVLVRPETVSGIVRRFLPDKGRVEAALRVFDDHLKHFDLAPIDDLQIERAIRLIRTHGLRAADALHLAAALLVARTLGRRPLRFATADREQAAAARKEGLKVIEIGA